MQTSGLAWLLHLKKVPKKVLLEAITTVCARNMIPSSLTRVTSGNSQSFFISFNLSLVFFWKSTTFRLLSRYMLLSTVLMMMILKNLVKALRTNVRCLKHVVSSYFPYIVIPHPEEFQLFPIKERIHLQVGHLLVQPLVENLQTNLFNLLQPGLRCPGQAPLGNISPCILLSTGSHS